MTSLSEQIILMRQSLDQTEKELKSLESGKKASAPRARKSLQSLKTSSHALRKQITEHTRSMPVKARAKKPAVDMPIEEARQLQAIPEEEPMPIVDDKPKKVRKSRAKKVVAE
jgi:TolA-binding protein